MGDGFPFKYMCKNLEEVKSEPHVWTQDPYTNKKIWYGDQ